MTTNQYDQVPYESYPYANTHSEHLFTVAKLFGLKTAAPKQCKVLELGCASGGNIIPMAIKYPDSEFVGIDLSAKQIEQGKKHIEKLGLKNLELKEMSILDATANLGKFDYIIVHGILSWVSKDVQDKIFEICSKNLTKKGVAYVSYNTLPGWNAIRSIREMMLYHTNNFPNPADKVAQAKLLLKFIKEGNGDQNSVHARLVSEELDKLNGAGDSYILHDHMEENNEPFYFKDFMEKANGSDLQYLGDTNIASMFVGNLPEETSSALSAMANDVVRTEQYMDFIRNRRFRSTLLCHKEVKLDRNLQPESIKDFYVKTLLTPTKNASEIDVTSNEQITFKAPSSSFELTTNNPAVISAILLLNESNKALKVSDVAKTVIKQLEIKGESDLVVNIIYSNFLRIALAGALTLSAFQSDFADRASDKPKVSDLARYQATYANWVTTQRAEKVNVDLFNRVLLQYLNGENDFDTIVNLMVEHVKKKEFNMSIEGKEVTGDAEIKEEVSKLVQNGINIFVPNALLVA